MIPISAAAKYLGVSISTLRRWDKKEQLIPSRTIGGHRRYSFESLKEFNPPEDAEDVIVKNTGRKLAIYSRVSSQKQSTDGNLIRQTQELERYAKNNFPELYLDRIFISEYGSGLNPNRRGLNQLIKKVKSLEIMKVLITYPDRLTRFGFPFLQTFFREYGVEIIAIDQDDSIDLEQQLVNDIMALMACFSGKLYQSRALKRKKKEKNDEESIIRSYIENEIEKTIMEILMQI